MEYLKNNMLEKNISIVFKPIVSIQIFAFDKENNFYWMHKYSFKYSFCWFVSKKNYDMCKTKSPLKTYIRWIDSTTVWFYFQFYILWKHNYMNIIRIFWSSCQKLLYFLRKETEMNSGMYEDRMKEKTQQKHW